MHDPIAGPTGDAAAILRDCHARGLWSPEETDFSAGIRLPNSQDVGRFSDNPPSVNREVSLANRIWMTIQRELSFICLGVTHADGAVAVPKDNKPLIMRMGK
jgi:hypothetical protein